MRVWEVEEKRGHGSDIADRGREELEQDQGVVTLETEIEERYKLF